MTGPAPAEPRGAGAVSLDTHVDGVEGGAPEHRYQPHAPRRSLVGPPLAEVTAHRLTAPDHWHLVTRGLSDLDDLPQPDSLSELDDAGLERPEVVVSGSGWGHELTFRVADTTAEPGWAVDLLTNMAAHVWSTGHPFAAGHHVDLRGPIRLDTASPITAAIVVRDPTLGVLAGPHGTVEFLQLVGLHADELELCRSWSTEGVIELLARDDPWLICDLQRRSLLEDAARREEIAGRRAGDGSALTELRVATVSWRRRRGRRWVEVQLGSGAAAALGPALRRELVGPGASFPVIGDRQQVRFVVDDIPRWSATGDEIEVGVPLAEVAALAALFGGRPGWGRRPAWPGLRFHVVP